MKNLRYIALFLVSFYATGCVIKREISFNSDYSGSLSYIVDYSGFKAMASMGARTDTTQSNNPDALFQGIDSLGGMLKNPGALIPGISNFKTEKDEEKGITTISCDFADLNSLNTFLGGNMPTGGKKKSSNAGFQQKGSTLTFTDPLFGFFDQYSGNVKEKLGGAGSQIGMMTALFQFETIIRFPVEVKKVSGNKGYQTDMEKKSLKSTFGYDQFQDKKLRKALKIKL